MSLPGFSITEILQAISKCKTLYDTFTDEYESAPARIRDLVDTCKYLHDILDFYCKILDSYGLSYAQASSFTRKLDECSAFIERYKALKQDYLRSIGQSTITTRLRHGWEQTWQTAKYAFDNNRASSLQAALGLEIQKLVLFILLFSLKRDTPDSTTSFSHDTSPTSRESIGSNGSSFGSVTERLQRIQYQHGREMNAARQQQRAPNTAFLTSQLEAVWYDLCCMTGLLQQGQAPPLPRGNLLEASSQNMNDAVMALARPIVTTPFQPVSSSQQRLSWASSSSSSLKKPVKDPDIEIVSEAIDSIHRISDRQSVARASTSVIPDSTSPPFGRPAPRRAVTSTTSPNQVESLRLATVTLISNYKKRTVRLRNWKTCTTGDSRRIVWTGENPAETLEHDIPLNDFPNTLHSSHGDGLYVTFPQEQAHQFILKIQGSHPQSLICTAEYKFLSSNARKEFQEDIRNKTLVGTFDMKVLKSRKYSRGRKGCPEAVLQDLKIWKNRRPPHHHSISFFASTRSNCNEEFPILWFQPKVRKDKKDPRLTHIDFVERKGSSSSTTSTGSRGSRRRISISTPQGQSQNPRRPSGGIESPENLPYGDIPDCSEYLTIEFSTELDAIKFARIFERVHSEDFLHPFDTTGLFAKGGASTLANTSLVVSPSEALFKGSPFQTPPASPPFEK